MELYPKIKYYSKNFCIFGVITCSSIVCSNIFASAFQLNEQNTSNLGNAYAGRSAIAEDASTSYYNPAGLVFMNKHQAVASLVNPFPSFKAKMNSLTGAIIAGKTSQEAAGYVPLPALHIAGPLMNNFYYGFSITAPFGLTTEYARSSQFRYFGMESSLLTMDFNPNVAYKFNDKWSAGVGMSVQYAEAVLERALYLGVLPDVIAKNKADNISYGYNFGALFQPSNKTRIGFSFRSKIDHTLKGKLKVTSTSATSLAAAATANIVNQNGEAPIVFPEMASLSVFQTLSPDWDIMGDVSYTAWRRFKKLVVKYKDTPLGNTVVEQKFRDTFKFSLGTNYKYSNNLTLKFGAAYDQTPVRDSYRNFRIPDADRYWLSTGLKYRFYKQASVDLAYTHIFMPVERIHENAVFTAATLTANAKVKSSIDLLGVQFNYDIA